MQFEERFRRTQRRAYEIYHRRDPNIGSAESDWWAAEAEIEGQRSEMGPARAKEQSNGMLSLLIGVKRLRTPRKGRIGQGMN